MVNNEPITRTIISLRSDSFTLISGWNCSIWTEGYREKAGKLGWFVEDGYLRNVDPIHGIRSIEVLLDRDSTFHLDYGLPHLGGEISYEPEIVRAQ